MKEIPFTFVGAQNNDPSIDESPLYDIAMINLGHYRNSADYEESVFWCGQAQPWISGLDEQWRDWMEKNGVYVGSRAPMMLPVGLSWRALWITWPSMELPATGCRTFGKDERMRVP